MRVPEKTRQGRLCVLVAAGLTTAISLVGASPALAQNSGGSADGAAAAAGGLIALFGIGMWCLWMGFVLLLMLAIFVGFGVWVWMLTDLAQRPDDQFPAGQTKALWLVLLLVAGIVGGAVYYFMVYRATGKARPAVASPAQQQPAASPPDEPPLAPPEPPST